MFCSKFWDEHYLPCQGLDALDYSTSDPITDKERDLIMRGLLLAFFGSSTKRGCLFYFHPHQTSLGRIYIYFLILIWLLLDQVIILITSPGTSIRMSAESVWTELSTAERSLYCTRQLWRRLHLILQIVTWEVKLTDLNQCIFDLLFWNQPWSPKKTKTFQGGEHQETGEQLFSLTWFAGQLAEGNLWATCGVCLQSHRACRRQCPKVDRSLVQHPAILWAWPLGALKYFGICPMWKQHDCTSMPVHWILWNFIGPIYMSSKSKLLSDAIGGAFIRCDGWLSAFAWISGLCVGLMLTWVFNSKILTHRMPRWLVFELLPTGGPISMIYIHGLDEQCWDLNYGLFTLLSYPCKAFLMNFNQQKKLWTPSTTVLSLPCPGTPWGHRSCGN